jgi:hypothetical protein
VQQYPPGCPPQPYVAAPPGYPVAGGTAVTGYPAAPSYAVQPAAVAAAPVQGVAATVPASGEPQGCCTVGVVLFAVSGYLGLRLAALECHRHFHGCPCVHEAVCR